MKLETFLEQRGIEFKKDIHSTAYTAQALAHAEHVSGYMVAKPVIVKGRSEFTMCVLHAPDHLDLQRVARALDEVDVRLATESEMAELFPDCELGAEPPIGALFGMDTMMDSQLVEDAYLVMQAGTHTEAVTVRRDDWERACNPSVASIALC